MEQSQYPLLLALLVTVANAEILFKNCEAPADLGGYDELGIFPAVCVRDHNFENRTHAWSFWKSVVRDTNFTSCTFADTATARTNFHGTTWQSVTFKKCKFTGAKKGEPFSFTNTLLEDVVFDRCVFDSTAELLFSQFAFRKVVFKNCLFKAKFIGERGDIDILRFENSQFGTNLTSASNVTVMLSQVSMDRFRMRKTKGQAVLRLQEAAISDTEISNSTLSSMWCHEELSRREDEATKTAELNSTLLEGVTFTDGMYCDQIEFRALEMLNIRVRNTMDLHKTRMLNLFISNITSYSNETCSVFDMSDAEVAGRQLEGIDTGKGTLANTVFTDSIFLKGSDISTTNLDLRGTTFSQEKINAECCTISCLTPGCQCDIPHDPVFCPRGNSSVNVNLEESCFPALSTVSILEDKTTRNVRMQDLEHGNHVIESNDKTPSEVYFFGHKSQQTALYILLSTYTTTATDMPRNRTLHISPGHILPVVKRGNIAARYVKKGDMVWTTSGGTAIVNDVKTRMERGMYAPTTLSGRMGVDGIVVTCYTEIVPVRLAHGLLAPLRAIYVSGRWGQRVLSRLDWLHGDVVKGVFGRWAWGVRGRWVLSFVRTATCSV